MKTLVRTLPRRITLRGLRTLFPPKNTVYVGSKSLWANPYTPKDIRREFKEQGLRPRSIEQVRRIMTERYEIALTISDVAFDASSIPLEFFFMRRSLKNLKGKKLGCECDRFDEESMTVSCHADILVRLANESE